MENKNILWELVEHVMTMKDCKFSCISCGITNYSTHWKPNFIVGLQPHFDPHISQTSSILTTLRWRNKFFFFFLFFYILYYIIFYIYNNHQPQTHFCLFFYFLFFIYFYNNFGTHKVRWNSPKLKAPPIFIEQGSV